MGHGYTCRQDTHAHEMNLFFKKGVQICIFHQIISGKFSFFSSLFFLFPFSGTPIMCVLMSLIKSLPSREEGVFYSQNACSPTDPHLEVAAQAFRPAQSEQQLSPGQKARKLKVGSSLGHGVFVVNEVLLAGVC